MTKKQMIEVIQQKEAEAFLQIKVDEKLFGTEHTITSKSRGEWAKINDLMNFLNILTYLQRLLYDLITQVWLPTLNRCNQLLLLSKF
jgi:hypothetical protein